jgi:putative ABC transport system permease protein
LIVRRISAFVRRVVALVSSRRREDDLRDEIDAHIELRRQALVDEGMDPRDAAFEARRMFGNVTRVREQSRENWSFPVMQSILQDIRYGARLLRRSPFFTLVAVTSIAFGLGGGLIIFAIANAFIFRPLAGANADLHRVYTANSGGTVYGGSSYADYRDFANAPSIFAATCATARVRANVTLRGEAARQEGALVTPRCFEVLGLSAQAGRLIGDNPSGAPEVVISYTLWNRRLGADPAAIGSGILVNGMPATIIGVARPGFHGTSLDGSADFWVGAESFASLLSAGALQSRRYRAFSIFAQLRDGVTRDQAEAALAGIAAELHRLDPAAWANESGAVRRVTVTRELESRFADTPGGVTLLLLTVAGAVAVIVSIACVNLATMLLARGAARTRELTIRLALGASRARILRQLATESFLIAAAGAGAALVALSAGIRLFEARRPDGIPAVDVAIDWRVALFAVAAASLATLLFGLAPAFHVVRLAIVEGMKGRVRAARGRWLRLGAREALIVVQVSASVALLLMSTLFARALSAGSAASPGFVTAGVALMSVDLENIDERSQAAATARVLRAVGSVRDVESPTIARMVPLIGSSMGFMASLDGAPERTLEGNVVAPGYFATMSIPLKSGRDFAERDRKGAPPVAIASETLARTLWNTTDVVGRTLTVNKRAVEIVGVVADTRYRAVNEPYRPVLYLPFDQYPQGRFFIHARVRGGGETLAALDRAVRSVDPRIVVDRAMPLDAWFDDIRAPERATQWIGGVAGVAQFALVLMALWALVAYSVERRTAEMGVRLALGATPRSLVQLVLRPALTLIAAGAVLGSGIGLAAGTVMASEFVGVADVEPLAGIPVILALAAVAAAAALVPARRVARVDPIAALRSE